MNTIQKVAKNIVVLLSGNIISRFLGFLYVMFIARHLGAEGFGILSFSLAFTGIFGVIADLGLGPLVIREVARDKSLASKYITNVTTMRMILASITFGLISLTINLLGYPAKTVKVVYLLTLFVIFHAFIEMFNSIFQAFEKMEYRSLGQILNSILMLIGVIFALKLGYGVVDFAFLYVMTSVIVLVYSFAIVKLKLSKQVLISLVKIIEFDWGFWKNTIKEAWPMGAKVVCVIIYFRIDTIMLSLIKGDNAVGIYGAAHRLSEIFTIIPAMFATSVFPVMSRYYKDSKNLFIGAYEKSVKYLLYLALPMALIVTSLARPIVDLIFGNEFSGSVIALQILIWTAAIMYVTMVLGATFVTANRQLLNLKITAAAVILNVILNLIVIPRYSYVGASATTLATEAFVLLVGIFLLNRCGYKLNITSLCVPPLLGMVMGGIAGIILINIGTNILIVPIVVVLIYAVIVYITGIKQDDKDLMGKMFNLPKIEA